MKKIVLLLSVLAVFNKIDAQNVASDFSNMHNAYLSSYLSLDFEVREYDSAKDTDGKFLGSGKVRKSRKNYYSIYDKQELLVANDKMVSVDHLEKQICLYNKLASSKTEKMNSSVMDTMLLEHADSVKFNGITPDGKWYSIYTSNEDAYRTDVTIDIQTNLVREIVYYYPSVTTDDDYGASKVVIRYTSLSTSKPDDSFFDFKKFVSDGANPHVTSDYKNYRFTIIN